MDWIIPVGIGVLAVLLLLLICWRRVPADKAMVITGLRKRVLVGRGGFVIPILETSCMISLEAVSMTTDITEAPSKQGIFVDIAGTAVVKVDNQHDAVLTAVEQFCNGNTVQTTQNIKTVVEQILEGKLRGIVSTLTVEQINEDRVAFENSIEDSITKELAGMGLKLLSYTVLKIATQGGYLENRAIPQIAQSKADADIASAERKRDTEVKTAEATREGEKAKLNAAAEIAESQRDKTLRTESYRADFTVRRDGKLVELPDVQFDTWQDDKGETHMSLGFTVYGIKKTPLNVLKEAGNSVLYYGRIIFASLSDLLRGRESINDLSGPVGIVTAIGQAASYGWQDLLEMLALITVNVGIFNLLPFPALDGGKVVFLLIEGVTGHAVPEKIQSGLTVAAFALLFGLMIFATYNDILRLITGAM